MNGPIEDTNYELRVPSPAASVLQALIDFGPLRPRIWPETSHPRVYRIHELGAHQAEVTEGIPATWSRERYDWSEPGIVTLTQVDSNVSRNGTIRYRIVEDGSGTRLVCNRHREFYGIGGFLAGTVMQTLGAVILRRQLRRGIERSTRLRAAR
jgi:hypothetical protein